MSKFDKLLRDNPTIKDKLSTGGYDSADSLPDDDAPVAVWQFVQSSCGLTPAEVTAIQKAVKKPSAQQIQQGKGFYSLISPLLLLLTTGHFSPSFDI